MLLGYARGKVGSLVFARRKGEQITRSRNTAPANPRTNAQMAQRMKMYAPVQLYRQSMRAFFKFAFNVAPKETIFNAYMRENIAIAPWTERGLVSAQAPIPFPARMSSGSVSGYSYKELSGDEYGQPFFGLTGNELEINVSIWVNDEQSATIGSISQAILAANPSLSIGDQITFVLCHTSGLSIQNGAVTYDGMSGFNFRYAKFVLDPNNLQTPDAYGLLFVSGMLSLHQAGNLAQDAVGGCVIVTRNEGSKVIASNSTLALNTAAQEIYELMTSSAYEQKAALSYKVTEDAYLNPATTE